LGLHKDEQHNRYEKDQVQFESKTKPLQGGLRGEEEEFLKIYFPARIRSQHNKLEDSTLGGVF
jgi:hypothetical protein